MLFENFEPGKACLVYCGDEACNCIARRIGNVPVGRLIRIPESNVRKEPIKKKRKKK